MWIYIRKCFIVEVRTEKEKEKGNLNTKKGQIGEEKVVGCNDFFCRGNVKWKICMKSFEAIKMGSPFVPNQNKFGIEQKIKIPNFNFNPQKNVVLLCLASYTASAKNAFFVMMMMLERFFSFLLR